MKKKRSSQKALEKESERIMREQVVSATVLEGYVDTALSVSALLGRKLTNQELETILAKQISSGYSEDIHKTLVELKRELSDKEGVALINTLLKQGKIYGAARIVLRLSRGIQIAELKKIQKIRKKLGFSGSFALF
jgi:hypothetical protein